MVQAVVGGDVATARARLDLPMDRVVVAVWSGSLGATKINEAVRGLAERWADRSDVAIRHIVGRRDWAQFQQPPAAVADGKLFYQLVEYENQMPDVLVGADVAVTRSGASTVAELAIAGLPAIMVPLPNAPRDHQRANTEELVVAGGGIVVDNSELTVDRLEAELQPLVDSGPKRAAMAAQAKSVARPDAAHRVAELIMTEGGIGVDR